MRFVDWLLTENTELWLEAIVTLATDFPPWDQFGTVLAARLQEAKRIKGIRGTMTDKKDVAWLVVDTLRHAFTTYDDTTKQWNRSQRGRFPNQEEVDDWNQTVETAYKIVGDLIDVFDPFRPLAPMLHTFNAEWRVSKFKRIAPRSAAPQPDSARLDTTPSPAAKD